LSLETTFARMRRQQPSADRSIVESTKRFQFRAESSHFAANRHSSVVSPGRKSTAVAESCHLTVGRLHLKDVATGVTFNGACALSRKFTFLFFERFVAIKSVASQSFGQ
jgi:hypothetical protein